MSLYSTTMQQIPPRGWTSWRLNILAVGLFEARGGHLCCLIYRGRRLPSVWHFCCGLHVHIVPFTNHTLNYHIVFFSTVSSSNIFSQTSPMKSPLSDTYPSWRREIQVLICCLNRSASLENDTACTAVKQIMACKLDHIRHMATRL